MIKELSFIQLLEHTTYVASTECYFFALENFTLFLLLSSVSCYREILLYIHSYIKSIRMAHIILQ